LRMYPAPLQRTRSFRHTTPLQSEGSIRLRIQYTSWHSSLQH
jgi:hypothetical protein